MCGEFMKDIIKSLLDEVDNENEKALIMIKSFVIGALSVQNKESKNN